MLATYRRQIDGDALGFLIAGGVSSGLVLSPGTAPQLIGVVIGLAAVWLSISGCTNYARAKGRSGLWGALGVVPIVGWPVVALLSDRCRAAGLPDEDFAFALKHARRQQLTGDPATAVLWFETIVTDARSAAERIQNALSEHAGDRPSPQPHYLETQLKEYEQIAQDADDEAKATRRKFELAADSPNSASVPILPVRRSELAVAAGYLGVLSVAFFPAPFAAVIGLLALHDIRGDPSKYGKSRAIFGLVVGVFFTIVLALVAVGALSRARSL